MPCVLSRAFNQRDTTREIERVRQELDKLIQSKARYYYEKNRKQAIPKRQHTPSIQMEQYSSELPSRNTNNDNFKRDCVVSVDKTLSSLQRDDKRSDRWDNIHRHEQSPDTQARRQDLYSNPIRQGQINDNTRSRAYSRSREIARRIRNNIDTAREDTERKERAIKRARELDKQISRFRDFIQSQFREFADTIRKRVKAVIEKRREKEREMQRHRQKSRGFSR